MQQLQKLPQPQNNYCKQEITEAICQALKQVKLNSAVKYLLNST